VSFAIETRYKMPCRKGGVYEMQGETGRYTSSPLMLTLALFVSRDLFIGAVLSNLIFVIVGYGGGLIVSNKKTEEY
jgi:hypothetical protein